jgi:hypothetical protein
MTTAATTTVAKSSQGATRTVSHVVIRSPAAHRVARRRDDKELAHAEHAMEAVGTQREVAAGVPHLQ